MKYVGCAAVIFPLAVWRWSSHRPKDCYVTTQSCHVVREEGVPRGEQVACEISTFLWFGTVTYQESQNYVTLMLVEIFIVSEWRNCTCLILCCRLSLTSSLITEFTVCLRFLDAISFITNVKCKPWNTALNVHGSCCGQKRHLVDVRSTAYITLAHRSHSLLCRTVGRHCFLAFPLLLFFTFAPLSLSLPSPCTRFVISEHR